VRAGEVRVHPDIVFTRWKVAVFVDGCFWHGCLEHQRVPKSNTEYWIPKLASNEVRDRRVTSGLVVAGWSVARVWEREDLSDAVEAVESALLERRALGSLLGRS
jgi:DNA mismatch endonuclease (patch repair protein)